MPIYEATNTSDRNTTFAVKPGTMGMVAFLQVREERVMSDVWENVCSAAVWCPEEGTFKWEHVWTSGFGGVTDRAEVDESSEIEARWSLYQAQKREREAEVELQREIERQEARLRTIALGKQVTVTRGKKVAKGLTGEVRWCGASTYGQRIGVSVGGAREYTFVDARNVDVVVSDEELLALRTQISEGPLGQAVLAAGEEVLAAEKALQVVLMAGLPSLGS